MQTSAIRHRVVDFLAAYPPFQEMAESDLLALVERGRVKFHECEEFVYWQNATPGPNFFVIQQGTVSLVEDDGGQERLRDIRGAGDMLGIERFLGVDKHLYSAKTNSDVILYALPSHDLAPLLDKYPDAEKYLASHASVNADYDPARERHPATQVRVYEAAWVQPETHCRPGDTVQEAARLLAGAGRKAIPIVDGKQMLQGVVTAEAILAELGSGRLKPGAPAASLTGARWCAVAPQASVSETILAMTQAGAECAVLTSDGTPSGRYEGIAEGSALAHVFGSSPFGIPAAIRSAENTQALRHYHARARQFLLEHLSAASVDWMARWAGELDRGILQRVLELDETESAGYCWCLAGASGRHEKLTAALPHLVLVTRDEEDRARAADAYRAAVARLAECGYRQFEDAEPDAEFACAPVSEWRNRFEGWVRQPIQNGVYAARPYFDLSAVHGDRRLWDELAAVVHREISESQVFTPLLANDCLTSLPPIAFLQDYVVDEGGEQRATFQLERSALWPLVDSGRVLGMAAGGALGSTTHQRLSLAAKRQPEHERIFRDAAETLRIVLYHQARTGIRLDASGAELPPSLLSRHDRHILKSGFRSIVRLLEFMESGEWQEAL